MKSYLITDPQYFTSNPEKFKAKLQNVFTNHTIDYACFRDKTSQNYEELATIFIEICKQNSIKKYFLNTNYTVASKLKASGVHLTSKQFNDIQSAKKLNLEVIISTHNEAEIEKAIKNNVDYITYSPIFVTPNKGKPKGIKKLNMICNKYSIPIIALGGITSKKELNQLEKIPVYGFASIRFFIS